MKVVSIRLEDDLLDRLERLAVAEHLDRTGLIRRLLSSGIREEAIENALRRYVKGEITLEMAAEMADVATWDITSALVERGMNHRGTAEELRSDVKKRLIELGMNELARDI